MASGARNGSAKGVSAVVWLSIWAHVVWLVLFAYAFWVASGAGACGSCQPATPTSDIINAAQQMGRLDIVALLLTFLGVVLAFGAVIGLISIKQSAAVAAVETAEEKIDSILGPLVTKWLDEKGVDVLMDTLERRPELLYNAVARVLESRDIVSETPRNADDIASSIGDVDDA